MIFVNLSRLGKKLSLIEGGVPFDNMKVKLKDQSRQGSAVITKYS